MKILPRRLLLVVLWTVVTLLSAGVASASATTLYVDNGNPDCTNTSSGTATQPFCPISAAASVVTAGQTADVEAASADPTTLLDSPAPSSAALAPALASSSSWTVSYSAVDPGSGGSGLAEVDLWAKAPGDGAYSEVLTDSSPGANGSFSYTAGAGDGSYSFYTVAIDQSGNAEAPPSAPDAVTVLDSTAPSSSASAPALASGSSITVSYSAVDSGAGASGLAEVDLWAEGPGDSAYAKVMTDGSPHANGSFSYPASKGDGVYSFYTVAIDQAGNTEAASGSADATTDLRTGTAASDVVDELHYDYTGQTSVAFDWRGSATDIRYGTTSNYSSVAITHAPNPMPFSSPGPFQQVELTGLAAGATYHYSIGGGPDHTFSTAPTGDFRFDVEADIGASTQYPGDTTIMQDIAGDNPAFVIMDGDLDYAHPYGQAAVDTHFNDVMAWSKQAAYMPAWGNHEWEAPADDDLRNYKGRFILPNAQASPTAPQPGGFGNDWGWFDAGGVRFISYPEPYDGESGTTWTNWQAKADPIFAAAQADPSVHYIVTYGHRPAYSDGLHPGSGTLADIINGFGDQYSKYVLNINGHSHDYERFKAIHGVVHITTGGGGGGLETPWQNTDPNTAFRAFHYEHLRVDVTSTGLRVDAICGPPSSQDDTTCAEGSVLDEAIIGAQPPPPPPPPNTLYVNNNQNANCTDSNPGQGTQAQPFCTIVRAATVAQAGQTVIVSAGTYSGPQISLQHSGTASAPIVFTAAPGALVTVTGGTNGCFYTNGKAYVTIEGFTVTGCAIDGIVVSKNSSFITIQGNHITNNGQPVSGSTSQGIRVDITHDDVIANNTVDHNTDYGIYVVGGSYNIQVTGNHVFANARGYQRAASGIRIHDSYNCTVSGNVTYDNEDSGIELVTNSHDNLVVNNVIYDNGDHGIDDTGNGTVGSGSPNNTFIGNTVYNNVTAGIDLEGGATGGTVMNNIAVDNGIDSPRTHGNIRVYSDSTPGTTLDYNLVYLTPGLGQPGQVEYVWGNMSWGNLAQMQHTAGQEAHAIEADPMFESPPAWTEPPQSSTWAGLRFDPPRGGDFHLHRGSPAIDSANSGVAGASSTDLDGVTRIDDPLTPNTGVGPRTYDDRGAYEYEPVDDPPTAKLSVTPSSGTVDLAVTADASASVDADGISPIATYKFDWGDGTASTGAQASPQATHTYTSAGTYTVTVTAVDTAGFVGTAQSAVTVKDYPPAAAVTADLTVGSAPLAVTADASGSTDGDATPIASYSFDWGDGTASTGAHASPQATHTYTSPGAYTVTVTVTDTAGLSSQDTVRVTALPFDIPPTAALAVSPSGGNIDLAVTADASASSDPDDGIAFYSFKWGDGTAATDPQSSPQATHTYTSAGTYTVTATVTDQSGESSTATQRVIVSDPAPVAKLTVSPSSGLAPVDVTADASASTDDDGTPIATYSFDWGDGLSTADQPAATATHTYMSAGNYSVKVTVTDTAGQATTATAQVAAQPNLVSNPGFETSLTGWNTSGSISGVTLTQANASYSGAASAKLATGSTPGTCTLNDAPNWVGVTSAGKYNASLWVRGDTAGATLKLRVVEYKGTTNVGSAIASVMLTTSWQKVSVSYTPVAPGSSTLDFNAYTTGVPASTTCFYADDAAIWPQNNPPVATLAVTPSSGTLNLDVTADASGSMDNDGRSPIASYNFDWGDGSPTTGPQTVATAPHTYTSPGTYTVRVTVTDTADLSSEAQFTVTVRDDPPVAALAVTPKSGPAPLDVTADASASTDGDASPIASYKFNWGDGSTPVEQTEPTGSHTYTTAQTQPYTVTVTVTDTAGNSSTTTARVRAYGDNVPPTAALSVSPSSGNVDLHVTADASASTDPENDISSYNFDWGDGSTTGDQPAATATHTYTKAGSYRVKVSVTDAGGEFSAKSQTVTVTDTPPVAKLTVSPSSGLAPVDVTADASASTDDDGTPIATYSFDWGDGLSTADQPAATATHTYMSAGNYSVKVTVTDTAGQATTATAQVAAQPNLVSNPGFETSLTGWNTSGSISGVTLTQANASYSGAASAKLATGSTPGTCTLNDAPNWVGVTSAGKYNASLWVRGDTAGATLKLRVVEYKGTTNVGSAIASVMLTTSWQKVSVSYTPVAPGSSTLDFNAYTTGVPASTTCFYADDAAIWLT